MDIHVVIGTRNSADFSIIKYYLCFCKFCFAFFFGGAEKLTRFINNYENQFNNINWPLAQWISRISNCRWIFSVLVGFFFLLHFHFLSGVHFHLENKTHNVCFEIHGREMISSEMLFHKIDIIRCMGISDLPKGMRCIISISFHIHIQLLL